LKGDKHKSKALTESAINCLPIYGITLSAKALQDIQTQPSSFQIKNGGDHLTTKPKVGCRENFVKGKTSGDWRFYFLWNRHP
jgi:hypothetical protein